MKHCPECGANFSERVDFCFDDGTPLVSEASAMDAPMPRIASVPRTGGAALGATAEDTAEEATDERAAASAPAAVEAPDPAGFGEDDEEETLVDAPAAAAVAAADADPDAPTDPGAGAPVFDDLDAAVGPQDDRVGDDDDDRAAPIWWMLGSAFLVAALLLLVFSVFGTGARQRDKEITVAPTPEVVDRAVADADPAERADPADAPPADAPPADAPDGDGEDAVADAAEDVAPEPAVDAAPATPAPASPPKPAVVARTVTPRPANTADDGVAEASRPSVRAPEMASEPETPAAEAPAAEGGSPWDAPDTPQEATARFTTDPAGAVVRIDGALRGKTPLDVALPFGSYEVELALDGYATVRRSVDITITRPKFPVVLQPTVPTGSVLVVAGGWDGATLVVDGQSRGTMPATVRLKEGVHRFELRDGGRTVALMKQVRFTAPGVLRLELETP